MQPIITLKPVDASPFTQEQTSPGESHLKKTLKKIVKAVANFFACLSCMGTMRKFFHPKQLLRLRDDCLRQKTATHLPDRAITPLQPSAINLTTAQQNPPADDGLVYTVYDDALEGLRQFCRDFTLLTIDVAHEKYFESKLETLQNSASSLPPVIKPIAKLLVEMGDKASKPLFKKFALQKAQVFDPALQKIFNTLLKEDHSQLMQLKDQAELYESLQTKIHEDLIESKVFHRPNDDRDYIRNVLDWLLCSDHSAPLTDLFEPRSLYQEDLIDKVFEKAITLLVERKIDQYASILEHTLQRRLGKIVHQMMRVNAARLSDYFTDRFSELISAMSFNEIFDTLLHDVISSQIQNFIAAEKLVNEDKALLQTVNSASQIIPSNAEELEVKVKAQNHLASIEKHGGEQAFFEHVFLEGFSKQPGCSSHTQEIVPQQIELIVQGKDPTFSLKESQKETFTKLADRILALMLPKRKRLGPNDEIQEIDPFTQLWDRLFIPSEFYELQKHVKELASEFITPEAIAIIMRFLPSNDSLQSVFKSIVQDTLKKHLVKLIQKAFDELTQPKHLAELTAASILPAVNLQLVKVLIRKQIVGNLNHVVPLFKSLIDQPDETLRSSQRKIIQEFLIKEARDKFHHFNEKDFFAKETFNGSNQELTFRDLSGDDLDRLALASIEKVEKCLLEAQKEKAKQKQSLSLSDITATIATCFDPPACVADPVFGQLLMDLIFKIGDWSNEALIKFAIKDTLSEALTEITWDIRESHVYLVNAIVDELRSVFLNRQRVEQMLSKKTTQEPLHTKQRLAHQIALISRLSYDMIMYTVTQKSWLGKILVKPFLSDQPDRLNNLISKVFQKMFSRQLLNENLLLRATGEFLNSMETAAKNLRKAQRLTA